MTEKDIINNILKEHPFMFRNSQGYCIACSPKDIHKLNGGGWKVDKGAPMHFGLFKGSSDMIGFKPTVITPDMVGQTVAIFQSIEVKTKNDRLSKEQKAWNRSVENQGGIVEVWQESKDGKTINKHAKKY